jgi:hypothetical protein
MNATKFTDNASDPQREAHAAALHLIGLPVSSPIDPAKRR